MGYDLIKTLRVLEWFERKKLSNWEGFQFCEDGFPKNSGTKNYPDQSKFWLGPRKGIEGTLRDPAQPAAWS